MSTAWPPIRSQREESIPSTTSSNGGSSLGAQGGLQDRLSVDDHWFVPAGDDVLRVTIGGAQREQGGGQRAGAAVVGGRIGAGSVFGELGPAVAGAGQDRGAAPDSMPRSSSQVNT